MKNLNFISTNKLKHSIAVGRYMQKYAEERLFDYDLGKELFILGYLHDIGSEFTEIKEEHAKIGGEILKKSNYKYWKEVYYHGKVQNEYRSLPLMLLNLAELSITSDGKEISIQEKLNELADKFGENSVQYQNTKKLYEMVRKDIKGIN